MRKNLEQLQAQARIRHGGGRRPKRRTVKKTPALYKRQRRIVSRFFVMRGWTTQRIADFFNTLRPEYPVNPTAVERWIRLGMPIEWDKTPQRRPQEEMRPYFE